MLTSFLSLPPELRNFIYDLAIREPHCIHINEHGHTARGPAILRTTRQIRAEALRIWEGKCRNGLKGHLFHVNNFDFTTLVNYFSDARRATFFNDGGFEPQVGLSVSRDFDMSTVQARLQPWFRHWSDEDEIQQFGP